MFDEGAFADFTKLPLVDTSLVLTEDRLAIAKKIMYEITINTAWRAQRTWIMRYPMIREEFDTKKTEAGDWDHRLRYYKDGHGYYLQSVWPEKSGAYHIPTYQNPPGWAEVSDKYGIPQWHIFESSINSYQKAGFRGDISLDWTKYFPNGATKQSVKKVVDEITSYDGMFRISICNLNLNNSGLKTVDSFLHSMTVPGSHARCSNESDCAHRMASFCFCLDLVAKNSPSTPETETRFGDVIDVGNWEGGSNAWCNG